MKRKKILALIMAAALLVASIPGAAVQADSISKEAQACKDLSILIGSGSGVTPEYLAETPTRIQAYIISLRLKGLYDEAGNYTGSLNFTDADQAGWAKSYMGYAKSKPELGWVGMSDGTFAPNEKINGQQFYKVMLETLGYKQGIDFTYDETLQFAENKKLVEKADTIQKMKSFTVDDVAKGIYSALNTRPKDSEKKLISVMVENGLIAADKAIAAGFTLDGVQAGVAAFNALSGSKLEVEFDYPINLQKSDVEITQVGGSGRLSVLSVSVQGNKAVITTTEGIPFNAYELTINTLVPTNNKVIKNYKKKFVAMPKDSTVPTAKHEVLGKNTLLVTFSEEVDRESAENPSNYIIEHNVIVLNAELQESQEEVLLKTTDMSSNNFYRLSVEDVCDLSGNRMDKYSALFEGPKKDTQGPTIATVKSVNSTSVSVTFSERVDAVTAEETDNYAIDNGVSVLGAKLDGTGKTVMLSTSLQKSGTIYNLSVQDVSDSWGNSMSGKDFRFVGDNTRPTAAVMAVSSNEVTVTYNKKVDQESAENIENYSIDNGLEVKRAILDGSGKVLTLITSDQTLREVYTLTIMNVFDDWGNMISLYSGKFGGAAASSKELSYTAKSQGGSLTLTFNKRLDPESAQDVFNYGLDSELGYAAKATLDDTGKIVTLLIKEPTAGKTYSISVSNVKDLSGNLISSDEKIAVKKFMGVGSSGTLLNTSELVLETVVTANVNTVDLVFSDELSAAELENMEVEVSVPDEYKHTLPSNLSCFKYFVGTKNNVRVQFKSGSSNNPELFKAGLIYQVEVTGIDRLLSKSDANIKLFSGTDNANETPKVLEVNAVNNTAVEVIFSEPVKGITKTQFDIKNSITISGVSAADSDEITDTVTLYLSSSTKLSDNDDYKLYVRSGVKDAAGLNSVEAPSVGYYEFGGNSEDNEAPLVESGITVLDSYTLQFEFSEPIKSISNGSFTVKRVSGSSSSGTSVSIANAVLSDDHKLVTLYLNSRNIGLSSGYEYELSIGSGVTDTQGKAVDSDNRKMRFDGEDTELEKLEIIASYVNKDNDEITLVTNRKLDISSLSIDYFELSGAGYYKSTSDRVVYDDKSITIKLKNELSSGKTLYIGITSSGRSAITDLNKQKLSTETVEVETN